MARILTCACCGAEITAPKRHNGKIYGYSCYAKMTGDKAKATKMVCLEFTQATRYGQPVEGDINSFPSVDFLVCDAKGKKHRVKAVWVEKRAEFVVVENRLYMSEKQLLSQFPNFEIKE